ncbi:hypothetical protein AVEN_224694-1 [Araneus ventricosus]|uniref:Deoxyuridine 5'-triphosphate nucleotidohydrolase n=1 Tax=Araneus ventricosus TaxID=182803 RepID=A0A4Y2LRJ4_ARAVE|nr:hypothetical protein AVEN_224694-1 [Araneus ventricosus]
MNFAGRPFTYNPYGWGHCHQYFDWEPRYPDWRHNYFNPYYHNYMPRQQQWPQYSNYMPYQPNWSQYSDYMPHQQNWYEYPDYMPYQPNAHMENRMSFVRRPASGSHNYTPKKKSSKNEKSVKPCSRKEPKNVLKQVHYKLTRPIAIEPSVSNTESPFINLHFPSRGVGMTIPAGEWVKINTHVVFKLPKGMTAWIVDKSLGNLCNKLKVETMLIDSRNRDEICINLYNMSEEQVEIFPGETIAQMLVQAAHFVKLNKVKRIRGYKESKKEQLRENQTVKKDEEKAGGASCEIL